MHWPSGLIIVTVAVLFQWLLVAFLFIAADIIVFVVAIAALLLHHHLILHVCTNQSQVLQIFFHKRLLSCELAELLAVLINHIKSSIKHGYLLSKLLLIVQLVTCAMTASTFVEWSVSVGFSG